MSDMGFRVFPSGFAIPDQTLSESVRVPADTEVTALYDEMVRGRSTPHDQDYFIKVVKKATELLGGGSGWLLAQAINPNLSKSQVAFTIDTIIMLQTGKRTKTQTTWRALCCDNEPSKVKPLNPGTFKVHPSIVLPRDILFSQPSGIISAWLASRGGPADLIESLYLMFGDRTGSDTFAR